MAADEPLQKISALQLPGVTLTRVELVPAGGLDSLNLRGVPRGLPSFCRVAATVKPDPDSNIRIEVWLPAADWNHRLMGIGGGGGAGQLSPGSLAWVMRRGYAAANCDLGTSPTAEEVAGHPARYEDFGSRSTHEMTVAAKAIVRAYYGEAARFNYFVGASTGGQQAMVEAQRFPEDYDGILAGCPSLNRTHLHERILWDWQALHAEPGSALPPEKIALVYRAIIKANAEKSGGAPGDDFLTDPRLCSFDPDSLVAPPGQAAGDRYLTQAQATALKRIYAGATNPRTGEQIVTPPPLGGEYYLTLSASTHALPNYYPYVFLWGMGPSFDPAKFDFDRDVDTIDRKLAPIMNANNPDLSAFRRHGGKLLSYTGTADTSVPYQDTLAYYERVVRRQGGLAKTQEFFRYFLVPGMKHASGGAGLGEFGQVLTREDVPADAEHNIVLALVAWVEQGTAPERFIAVAFTDGDHPEKGIRLQRPIYPYPLFPQYVGGDPTAASSYRPVAHQRGGVPKPAERYLN